MNEFTIEKLSIIYEEQAKALILNGFLDYFNEIDHSLNPDVYRLMDTYSKPKHVFLVGMVNGSVVSTGGLLKEGHNCGRIVRMSVARHVRRAGYASKMLTALELEAKRFEMNMLLIETNAEWVGPIRLYERFGYAIKGYENGLVHFIKHL